MRYLIFYRVYPSIVQYTYVYTSAMEHLQKYNRLTLYEHISHRTIIRHASNIFIAPDFINSIPLVRRVNLIGPVIDILKTIPFHKPFHIDFDDYPELFI